MAQATPISPSTESQKRPRGRRRHFRVLAALIVLLVILPGTLLESDVVLNALGPRLIDRFNPLQIRLIRQLIQFLKIF